MDLDARTIIDFGIAVTSGINLYIIARIRAEIAETKLWVAQNFVSKPR